MALPTKTKTWTLDPCNRVTYSSVLQVVSDTMLAIKNALKLISGVTVKGSGTGTVAAMDGVDRWATAADVQARFNGTGGAQSWIVLDLANMGGVELLLTYNSASTQGFSFYFSPGGNYAAAGTATHKPTAADEVTIRTGAWTSTGTGDRLWTTWAASDGSALAFGIAQAGGWESVVALQLATSRVEAPATFSPAAVGFHVGSAGSGGVFSQWATATPKCRADGGAGAVNVDGFFGAEGYKAGIAGTLQPNVCELQGSGHNMYPVSVWSETVTARGPVCNLTDVWCGNTGASDGDTYPNDATYQFVQVNDLILPWDGTAVTMS